MPLAELTVAPRYGALPLAAARLALRSVLPMQATGAAMNDRTNDHTKLMKLIALAGSDNDAEAIASLVKRRTSSRGTASVGPVPVSPITSRNC